jgi:hypothetical protein
VTGPVKAALIIALAVVALIGLNVAMWRRMKAAIAAGRAAEAERARELP